MGIPCHGDPAVIPHFPAKSLDDPDYKNPFRVANRYIWKSESYWAQLEHTWPTPVYVSDLTPELATACTCGGTAPHIPHPYLSKTNFTQALLERLFHRSELAKFCSRTWTRTIVRKLVRFLRSQNVRFGFCVNKMANFAFANLFAIVCLGNYTNRANVSRNIR